MRHKLHDVGKYRLTIVWQLVLRRLPLGCVPAVDCQTSTPATCMNMTLDDFIRVAEAGVLLWRVAAKPAVE
jgi:hypothetical protein